MDVAQEGVGFPESRIEHDCFQKIFLGSTVFFFKEIRPPDAFVSMGKLGIPFQDILELADGIVGFAAQEQGQSFFVFNPVVGRVHLERFFILHES